MLASATSKVVWLVAAAYLALFFALASGLVNALVEGKGVRAQIVPSRTIQTIGETVVTTMILFIGMAGALMLYQSGRSPNPKVQQTLLISGFGIIGIALLLGFMLVNIKL
jgi:hypothetical protein